MNPIAGSLAAARPEHVGRADVTMDPESDLLERVLREMLWDNVRPEYFRVARRSEGGQDTLRSDW